MKGHNVSHANNKTKRRFLPSIKKVKFKSDLLKKNIKLNVSNSALRTVDFKGGIDQFLKSLSSIVLLGCKHLHLVEPYHIMNLPDEI